MTELWLLRLCHGPIWVLGCQFEGVSSCLSHSWGGGGGERRARHGAWDPRWGLVSSHQAPWAPAPAPCPPSHQPWSPLTSSMFPPSFPHFLPLVWLPGCSLGLWLFILSRSLNLSDPLSPTTSPPFFFPHDGSGADGLQSGIFSHIQQPTLSWWRAGLVTPVDSWPSEYQGLLGCHGLDNGLYEIYAGADTSSRGECSHGCFNGETQLGRGEKRLEKGREGARAQAAPGWRERVEPSVSYCAELAPAALYFSDPISGWGSSVRAAGSDSGQLLDSSSSFLCCSTGTNDFFSPFSVRFLWLLFCVWSACPRVAHISAAGPWGEAASQAGDRSRGAAGGVLTAPRRSSAGAAQSWQPPWAGPELQPHLVSSHCAGPGARNATCHMSAPMSGDMTGASSCVLVFSLSSSSSSYWHSVFWLMMFCLHTCLSVTKPDSIVMIHFCHSSNSFRSRLL